MEWLLEWNVMVAHSLCMLKSLFTASLSPTNADPLTLSLDDYNTKSNKGPTQPTVQCTLICVAKNPDATEEKASLFVVGAMTHSHWCFGFMGVDERIQFPRRSPG
jgi:hypothetical protein